MLENETMILLCDLPDHLPKRSGKKLNLSTVYRWRQNGLHGVRLEWCIHGGRPCTSLEAVARFDKAVSEKIVGPRSAKQEAATSRAHEAAKKRLAKSLA